MPEVWLRSNARAIWFALAWAALFLLAGLAGAAWAAAPAWLRAAAGLLAVLAGCLAVFLAAQLRQPRLAREGEHLLVYLRAGRPFRLPLEVVECFLLGKAPSGLPGRRHAATEAATVVIRLAERAVEWRQREVRPAMGSWCAGQVTIRGTWCEPLNLALVQHLNDRLAAAQRELAPRGRPPGIAEASP